MRTLFAILVLALPAGLGACASPDIGMSKVGSSSTIEERFDALVECLRACQDASADGDMVGDEDEEALLGSSPDSRWNLSPSQRSALRRAGVRDPDEMPGPDRLALATLLEFGESLTPAQRETVARLSLEPRCRAIAFGLAHIFVERGPLDAAARLMVAGVVELKRTERGKNCWKWWFTSFSTRPAFPRINRDIAHALLRVAETGDATTKEVVADLFNERELTPDAIARVRARADSIRQ